eukprot:scaffold3504_cov240-Pinguiococcus_pyrenoidosus.AAC.42
MARTSPRRVALAAAACGRKRVGSDADPAVVRYSFCEHGLPGTIPDLPRKKGKRPRFCSSGATGLGRLKGALLGGRLLASDLELEGEDPFSDPVKTL